VWILLKGVQKADSAIYSDRTKGALCRARTAKPFSEISYILEVVSKRFSLVKVKAGDHFNRRNTLSISRIEM
jgi:hypothetical protein